MSITTTTTKDSYVGNASSVTPYPITFKYLENSHVSVYIDDVLISDSYYTLGGDGTAGTGSFTTSLAYAATKSVVVVLDVPFDQPTSLAETSALPAKTLEESFDRLNMQIRRVWRKVQNTLTFSTDEGGTGSTGTADNLLGFDGTGVLTELPNSTFVASNGGIDNISDVTITGVASGEVIAWNGSAWVNTAAGNGDALIANSLDQFAATTSLQLKDTISDETGSGALVFGTSPTLVTPALGTPSAVDLTNATNTPLPATGTVTEAMLNASTNASLDLADSAIQIAGGTVQGTDGTYDIKAVASNDTVTPNARGEGSVDLQTERLLATQVASGSKSALVGGVNNTASGLQSGCFAGGSNVAADNYSTCVGGTSNNALAANSAVVGGYTNTANANRAFILGGANCVSTGIGTFLHGNTATTAHLGARVFADSTVTALASRQTQEFAIQASALRLEDGNEAVGKVLTCNHADGSSNWAAPAKVVYTVATLPATPAQGDVAMVTDATATTFNSTVAGTGANIVPVFYNGTNWKIG